MWMKEAEQKSYIESIIIFERCYDSRSGKKIQNILGKRTYCQIPQSERSSKHTFSLRGHCTRSLSKKHLGSHSVSSGHQSGITKSSCFTRESRYSPITRPNECVTASSFDLEDSWPAGRRESRRQFSAWQIRESASSIRFPRSKVLHPRPPTSPAFLPFSVLSWCFPYSSGPSNWYYYGPERPSHYVINVTRVDYRSLFRTCLHCPRTMLDPLPLSPPVP